MVFDDKILVSVQQSLVREEFAYVPNRMETLLLAYVSFHFMRTVAVGRTCFYLIFV